MVLLYRIVQIGWEMMYAIAGMTMAIPPYVTDAEEYHIM